MGGDSQVFNIVIVGQSGRLMYEALLFAASLRAADPGFPGRLLVAEPAPGPVWPRDPSMNDPDLRAELTRLGAEILPFEARLFGGDYPNGNKAEALAAMPAGTPFLFFDTDTIALAPLSNLALDFDYPTASMMRENTWPKPELYGPPISAIWQSLYDRFGLDFETSQDPAYPPDYWRRYLYFNASWFLGPCPRAFGRRLAEVMRDIRDTPPEALTCQALYPWLDQIALPLVIHEAGGGRPRGDARALDSTAACHWRVLPLFYARADDAQVDWLEQVAAPNRIKKILKKYEPFRRMIYQGRGRKARALFDRTALPRKEQAIRNRIKSAGLWMR